MNRDKQQKPDASDKAKAADVNGTGDKTPSTDMQPEDTGTPDSGNTGTAAQSVMKQTSKTPAERK